MGFLTDTEYELELDYEDAEEFACMLGNCSNVFLKEDEKGYVTLTHGINKVEVEGQYGNSSWRAETTKDSDAIKYLEEEGYLDSDSTLDRLLG